MAREKSILIKDVVIGGQKKHILISGEKIKKIVSGGSGHPKADILIEGKNFIALPGAIDPHVHFDTPGYTWREDFAHGTRAAAAGGVTCVIDMPCTSVPPVTSRRNLEKKRAVISKMACVDFALFGGVSSQMMKVGWKKCVDELIKSGVVGFKCYLISGMNTFRELSAGELKSLCKYASKKGTLIAIHAEDPGLIRKRQAVLMAKGKDDPYDHYLSRRDPAECMGVMTAIANAGRARLHIVHLASKPALSIVRRAKKRGLDLSAETCPQYLAFTAEDLKRYGSRYKTSPVVKTKADRAALLKAIAAGEIDFLASDHAPCPLKEKQTGSIWTDYSGMPGVETILPFAVSELFLKGKISYERLAWITSTGAAIRYGLYPRKGALAAGSDADIVLINPKGKWKVTESSLHSLGKMSGFAGRTFKGKAAMTILRGKIIYDGKDVVGAEGFGKFVRSER